VEGLTLTLVIVGEVLPQATAKTTSDSSAENRV
jgi:hypothetical protein